MLTTDRIPSFDGVQLSVTTAGTGPTALLLHGYAADADVNWIKPGIFDAIVASGRHVIAYDARGHGASDKPRDPEAYENEAMGNDASAVLDHYGINEVDLIGYSMGALTAMRLTPDEPRTRSLVLGGIGGGGANRPSERAQVADAMEAGDATDVDDRAARAFRRYADRRGNDLQALAALQRSEYKRKPGGVLRRITVPTLVVAGFDDGLAGDPAALAARITNGEAKGVPGDHLTAVGKPELTEAIVNFLARVSPS